MKITFNKKLEDYEFWQDVSVFDYITNGAFWSYFVSTMVVHLCVPLRKLKIDIKEKRKWFGVKQKDPVIPDDPETRDTLVRAMSVALEGFWSCYRRLWQCISDDDPARPRASLRRVKKQPALACLNVISLALFESKCNIEELQEYINNYVVNPSKAIEQMSKKGFAVNTLLPCKFAKMIGLEAEAYTAFPMMPFC